MNSPGSTWKYPARARMCLIPSFRFPARISDRADCAIPAPAAFQIVSMILFSTSSDGRSASSGSRASGVSLIFWSVT